MGTILCSVKQSDFFQQMEFHKATKVNLVNLTKNNKGSISAFLIYYLEMTKCLLNFVHLKRIVNWISQTGILPDLYSWSNFQGEYNSYNNRNRNRNGVY